MLVVYFKTLQQNRFYHSRKGVSQIQISLQRNKLGLERGATAPQVEQLILSFLGFSFWCFTQKKNLAFFARLFFTFL